MQQRVEHQSLQGKDVYALADVGLLSAGIIHEVRNALQGISNALFLLESERDLRPHARAWIADARRELSRAVEVSHETLALVRDDSAVPVRIHDVLEEVLSAYSSKIKYKDVCIDRRYEFHETIHADPVAVRQVFANIILNAVEAAPDKCGKLAIHTFAHRRNGHNAGIKNDVSDGDNVRGVRIVFADNGPGIPEENKKRVFEPLFSTKKGKGTGLGLWITEKLIRKQQGEVRLRSSSRKSSSGTCFSVFLPLRQESGATPKAA